MNVETLQLLVGDWYASKDTTTVILAEYHLRTTCQNPPVRQSCKKEFAVL